MNSNHHADADAHNVGGVSGAQLRAFVERIERLEEEKAGIQEDIRDVFGEAKANGFDTKIMRQILRIRKMDRDERDEQETLLDLYLQALGMRAGGEEQVLDDAA